ncbi:MAG: hypothetical protein WAN34_10005, partial [Acidimicrobiia bacterium]
MPSERKPTKKVYTFAAAIGLALGTMGIAAAASTPAASTTTTQPQVSTTTQPQVATPSTEPSNDVANPDDETVDGVDHQFEGEEVGNNGDG